MGAADGRDCKDVKAELKAAGNERYPWFFTNTPPRCRIEIAPELDLDRLHTANITDCIKACHNDDNCQAITYSYAASSNTADNCWLKIATTATRRRNESALDVTVVSLFKPSFFAVAYKTPNSTFDCANVTAELHKLDGKDTDKWKKQEPLCRVDFRGNSDLTRYHVANLSECITYCNNVPACKGLTYGFGAPTDGYDNCWLKGSINNTVFTPEDSQHVVYVSSTKPVQEKTCFQDAKCTTAYALGTIGTVLGLMSTLGSMVVALVRSSWQDDTLPNVFRRASSAMGKAQTLTGALFSLKSLKKGGGFE